MFVDSIETKVALAETPAGLLISRTHAELNEGWIRDFCSGTGAMQPTDTPYKAIGAIPSGAIATFRVGHAPHIDLWWDHTSKPSPTLSGENLVGRYREVFDDAVDAIAHTDHVSTTLSGGLDSTFMVATMALSEKISGPIHAFCHSPHPDSVPMMEFALQVTDDYAAAETLAARYKGRMALHRVFPEAGANPLDAALARAVASGIPSRNPANTLWMAEIGARSRALGAQQLFIGSKGNLTYSYPHHYAVGFHTTRGQLGKAWRAARTRQESPWPTFKHLARSTQQYLFPPKNILEASQTSKAFGTKPKTRLTDLYRRGVYVDRLAPQQILHNGQGLWNAHVVDPYSSASVINLAAAIAPGEWRRPAHWRGFAREVAADRVPDEIRLRVAKGAQGVDEWFLMHRMRDRYMDELNLLPTTSVVGDYLDTQRIRAIVEGLPWGDPHPPDALTVRLTNRVLHLAAFIRMSEQRRLTLPESADTLPPRASHP